MVWINGGDIGGYNALRVPPGWKVTRRAENVGMRGALNEVFARYPDEPFYGFLSDDSLVRSRGWSDPIVKAAGSTGFANSGDGWQAASRMHGAVVMGGDLVRALGWWAPPEGGHCYLDNAWEKIARALDNWTHVPQILVEHLHPGKGNAEFDATYADAYSSHKDDKKSFMLWLRDKFPAAIERVLPILPGDIERKRRGRARSRSLMIGTPVARAPALAYTISLANTMLLLDREGISSQPFFVVGSSNLPSARNHICATFLASENTDLVMIDDDMGWDANAILRLLASPQPIAGLVGRKKCAAPNTDPDAWCGHPEAGPDGDRIEQDEMGFVKFARIGTGILRVSRAALNRIAAARPEWKSRGRMDMPDAVRANYHRFFRFSDDEYETGEDFAFCAAWRDLGGEIWADVEQKVSHVGEFDYSGRFNELMLAKGDA